MPLYRVLSDKRRLQLFRPTELGSRYSEKDLEDWMEANPEILIEDEPLLIVGRQVNTPIGVIDLLALDSNGTGVVIELKRGPSQREAASQSIEYAAWLESVDSEQLREIADRYLRRRTPGASLETAWAAAFGTDLPEEMLNTRQRIVVVVEGEDERLISMVRYLRSSGVDILLLGYSFYKSDADEEILLLDVQVGETERPEDAAPTEQALLDAWGQRGADAYRALKATLQNQGLYMKVLKSAVSFRLQTQEQPVFICFFAANRDEARVSLRSDSLGALIPDFDSIVQVLRTDAPRGTQVKCTPTWLTISFPATEEAARAVASLILREVVDRLH